ncbi:hypothetical protein QL285_067162 [Trifolium repens]|nr:hypothetical protein QL285_067162 [Trifolium repens]
MKLSQYPPNQLHHHFATSLTKLLNTLTPKGSPSGVGLGPQSVLLSRSHVQILLVSIFVLCQFIQSLLRSLFNH